MIRDETEALENDRDLVGSAADDTAAILSEIQATANVKIKVRRAL